MTATVEQQTPSGTGLALTSVLSVQFGAALAAHLFDRVGPLGTVALRLLVGALVLVAITRPWRRTWTRPELGSALLFGAVFTAMNSTLYLAIERLPLATVITLEFLGPLTVAIVTSAGWTTRVWALPAAAGVALLAGALPHGSALGVVFALAAATCWGSYIVLSGRLGRTGTGLSCLAVGCVAGAVIMLPLGVATAGTALWAPDVIAIGAAIGVISTAIPYSFDLLALRRLPTAVFGVLTSLNPGVAALAGLIVLGQALSPGQLAGVVLVMLASVGVTVTPTLRRGTALRSGRSRGTRPRAA